LTLSEICDNVLILTEPVTENFDEEDENEKILPITMAMASATSTATSDAVHYAVAMTTSPHPHHRDPAVVEIDLLDQGYCFTTTLSTVHCIG